MIKNTCCFFGHRTINETKELKSKLIGIIEKLIVENSVNTFLFGSKSRFDDLCYELVTEYKEKYPYINRIYVRAEYSVVNDSYKKYLLNLYEDTYYPESVINSGKACYIKRNYEMIDKSKYCIVYFTGDYAADGKKSGTRIALNYAYKKDKTILFFS